MMLPSGRLVDSLGAHRMAAIGATFWSIAQMLERRRDRLRHACCSPASGLAPVKRHLPGQLSQRP